MTATQIPSTVYHTGKVGTVAATYAQLVAAFGPPAHRDDTAEAGDGKIRIGWVLRESGSVVWIHDWKDYGTSPESMTSWSVGGHGSPDPAARLLGRAGLRFKPGPWR